MPEKPVISNTSPLVGLWTLNLFPILRELYTEVLIPEEVRAEFFATENETRTAAVEDALQHSKTSIMQLYFLHLV